MLLGVEACVLRKLVTKPKRFFVISYADHLFIFTSHHIYANTVLYSSLSPSFYHTLVTASQLQKFVATVISHYKVIDH